MITQEITLRLWENNRITLLANQGEVNSRYVTASFKENDESNLSLSGKSVTFYATKPDGNQVFNNCTINTSNNTVTVMLTSQMSAIAGILECEFQIFDSNNTLLKVNGIKIIISIKGDFSEAIESTSEFNALTQAINNADNFSDSIGYTENLTTAEKGTLVGAINELNSKTIPISQGGTGGTTAVLARTNLGLRKEYVLYENLSGTAGTIELADNFNNYNVIKVYFSNAGLKNSSETITSMSNTKANLTACGELYSGSVYWVIYYTALLGFSGSTATFEYNVRYDLKKSSTYTLERMTGSSSITYVVKIVGYKY